MVCEVTQVERGDKNIVVSRRNVLIKEREEQVEEKTDELRKQNVVFHIISMVEGHCYEKLAITAGYHIIETNWAIKL